MLKIVTAIMTKLHRDEEGASAVEYAILVGAVGAAVFTATSSYGTAIGTLFSGIINSAW